MQVQRIFFLFFFFSFSSVMPQFKGHFFRANMFFENVLVSSSALPSPQVRVVIWRILTACLPPLFYILALNAEFHKKIKWFITPRSNGSVTPMVGYNLIAGVVNKVFFFKNYFHYDDNPGQLHPGPPVIHDPPQRQVRQVWSILSPYVLSTWSPGHLIACCADPGHQEGVERPPRGQGCRRFRHSHCRGILRLIVSTSKHSSHPLCTAVVELVQSTF